jgi:hypothetical protein
VNESTLPWFCQHARAAVRASVLEDLDAVLVADDDDLALADPAALERSDSGSSQLRPT